jgi:hypothetical protein
VTHLDVAGKVYYTLSSHGRLFLLLPFLPLLLLVTIIFSILKTNEDTHLKLQLSWKTY